jgi:hypothetical protein
MSTSDVGRNRALNVALLLLGLAVLVLVYAMATRAFSPRVDPSREANPTGLVGTILQVEVRNACGADGIAAQTTQYLRRHGFDVVEVGDHTSFSLETSQVIDRVGDLEAAKKVAAALGIDEAHVTQDIQPDYYLDASILLGRDYTTLKPFTSE